MGCGGIAFIAGPSARAYVHGYTGWAKKVGHRLMTIILLNLNRFKKISELRFPGKFVVHLAPCVCCYTTL